MYTVAGGIAAIFVSIWYVLPVGGIVGMPPAGNTAARGRHMLLAGGRCPQAAQNIYIVTLYLSVEAFQAMLLRLEVLYSVSVGGTC